MGRVAGRDRQGRKKSYVEGVDGLGRKPFVIAVKSRGDGDHADLPRESVAFRGKPIDVLHKLLDEGMRDEVVALFNVLATRNEDLEKALAALRSKGNRSERVSAGQLDIFLDKLRSQSAELVVAADGTLEKEASDKGGRADKKDPPKQPPVRRPPSPKLRRVDNPISVPVAERPCPQCGAERRCIHHETTETIDLIPAEIIVRVDRREILACDACDGAMQRAPMGDKVVSGGLYGSRLVGQLVVDKYWTSTPLNRQAEALERMGLTMPSSSMSDQVQWATDLLRPLHRALIAGAIAATILHVDATSLPVRDKDTGHQVVLGSLWGYVLDEQHALFLYTSTGKKNGQRPGEIGPEDLLRKRKGYVVADASNIFEASFARPDLIEVGCNMHARRYFVKALEANDARAAPALKAFQALYDIEDDIADADDAERLRVRQERSKPVYDQLLTWCDVRRPIEPPSSLLGVAMRYLNNHRVALTRFLDDGVLPIDNGIVERLHRRPAVGRRNFLFAGSHAGGDRAAIAYSILGSCSIADVDPVEYLADVLPRLAREGVRLDQAAMMLPAAWKRGRALTVTTGDAT